MVVNIVMFILIIKGITCDRAEGLRSTQKKGELVKLQVQTAIACFVVMGLYTIHNIILHLFFSNVSCIFQGAPSANIVQLVSMLDISSAAFRFSVLQKCEHLSAFSEF